METKVYFIDSLERREVMTAKSNNSLSSFSREREREDSAHCIGFNTESCCGRGKKNMTRAVRGLCGNGEAAGGRFNGPRKH